MRARGVALGEEFKGKGVKYVCPPCAMRPVRDSREQCLPGPSHGYCKWVKLFDVTSRLMLFPA
jgi:hypothetical protein